MSPLELPPTDTLELVHADGVVHVTLARPQARNAMSAAMVRELVSVFEAVRERRDVRVIVLRGSGGHFCAGGDIKDMSAARSAALAPGDPDPIAVMNRQFGAALSVFNAAPQAVIAVCEGAVMGGGFGLACVADVTIAVEGAKFRLPETSLGVTPAQIAPFIVQRVGITHARRLAVTGARLGARDAVALGIAHRYAEDTGEAERLLAHVIDEVRRCEPHAVALTKQLMLKVAAVELEEVLDDAARDFADAARSDAAVEGMTAFMQRRPPAWAPATKEPA